MLDDVGAVALLHGRWCCLLQDLSFSGFEGAGFWGVEVVVVWFRDLGFGSFRLCRVPRF